MPVSDFRFAIWLGIYNDKQCLHGLDIAKVLPDYCNEAIALISDRKEALPYKMSMKGGSKYQALQDFLHRSDRPHVTLTFADIEALIGTSLPGSARSQRAWWSNRSKGALQASAWMNAGYLVEELDLEAEHVTFHKPPAVYKVQRIDDTIQWTSDLVKALRLHMGFTQAELAKELGVRQQTISEWEKGMYTPTRASSKHLTLVAEKADFKYEENGEGF